MRNLLISVQIPVIFFILGSCGVGTQSTKNKSGNVVCTDSSGNQIEATTIYGKWKKVTGYEPERTAASLAINFEIMVFEKGLTFCGAPVVNSAMQTKLFIGSYAHDVDKKKLLIQYTDSYDTTRVKNNADEITYSFSGTCEDLKLNLNYNNHKDETYELYSKDVSDSPCNSSSGS